MFIKLITIRSFELGLEFVRGEFQRVLGPGRYALPVLGKRRIEVVSTREALFAHPQLDVLVAAGVFDGRGQVLDLADHERALIWIDGRFTHLLAPGLHALWTTHRRVRAEVVDIRAGFFEHEQRDVVTAAQPAAFAEHVIDDGQVGVLIKDGAVADELKPGRYALWRAARGYSVRTVELREQQLDVSGQEIMTADRVTLRLNVLVGVAVAAVRTVILATEDAHQALYRAVQLALRAAVGTRSLEQLLADKTVLADELREAVRERAAELGLRVTALGVRDIILPGEMKALLNKVTEAKAAAEANLITRREETAAMRSQLNTARLFQDHPTLMRLRELEVLERIAKDANLQVILGEQGLSDRITKLI